MRYSTVISFLKEVSSPFKLHCLVFIVFSILWAVDLSLRPYIIKLLIDQANSIFLGKYPIASITRPILWYMLLSLIMVGAASVYEWLWTRFYGNFKKSIGTRLMAYLLHKPYAFYQDQFTGALASRLNNCIDTIPRLLRIFNEDFLRYTLALLISGYTLWQVSPYFAIALIVWVILYLFACISLAPKVRQLTNKISKEASRGMGHMSDILSNIMNVKLFCKEVNEHTFVEGNFTTWVEVYNKRSSILVRLYIVQLVTFILLQGLCLYLLCRGLGTGNITAGDFALIFMINISINNCLFGLSRVIADFNENIGTLIHSLQMIEPPNEPNTILHICPSKTLHVTAGKIAFEYVYFNYKGSPLLFENMCVTIEPGQKVALVGPSGGGKSTFIHLILKLYELTSGRILIDNQDIDKVSLTSLRDNIAFIPQDPFLFHRTLKENIHYGRPGASYEEVIKAAQQAHAHEFIERLPKQYEAMVGERGVKLSGGQRQRIAIARVMLKNAPIMILDEATSQLDSVTEKYIQESLWDIIKGKTTFVIAHRLSTLLYMDRILVFDRGRIIEDGTHYELLTKKGMYKSLWDTQVGGFLLNSP